MKTYLDCIPCFMDQALRAGRIATNDESLVKKLLEKFGSSIETISMQTTPPQIGDMLYKEIRKIAGNDDVYAKLKKQSINEAITLYPQLKEFVSSSANPLLTAVRIAIAGNVIDLAINKNVNINEELHKILNQDFAIFDFYEFAEYLGNSKSILYLGDNAGESVFDKVLIEELDLPVTYVVRDVPVINDVTFQDAIDSGLDEVAKIISSGSSAPGIILELCSGEFRKRFYEADMVIAKGQGNYEGLSDVKRSVFFLLKAKCRVIANDLNVDVNDIVLKGINTKTKAMK